MKPTLRGILGLAATVAVQASVVGFACAQGTPPGGSGAGSTPGYDAAGAPPSAGPDAPSDAADTTDLPVLYVTSVEVLRTATEPKVDIVRVSGLAASQGWNAPQLVPTYAGKPADDILDLQFIATSPSDSQGATGFVPLNAILALEQGHPFKGVRVRAAENAIEIKELPGSKAATISANDCKDCVGKKFVTTADAQPGQSGVVRQQDFPKLLRVIAPSDGIRGTEQNPNRLTLILGDDNTVVEAFWE